VVRLSASIVNILLVVAADGAIHRLFSFAVVSICNLPAAAIVPIPTLPSD